MNSLLKTVNSLPQYELLIDGAVVPGDDHFDVINPATEELVGRAPRATRAQLDSATRAARKAFPAWRDTPIAERQAMVAALAAVFSDHVDELSCLLTAEHGKPLRDAKQDVLGGGFFCSQTSKITPPVEVHEDSDKRRVVSSRVPLGVVCAIAPWNFPVMMAFWKAAPALVAGNTVVLKPSPFTPLTTLRIASYMRDMLPRGVLNVLTGGDELGPWMTSHPGFNKVSFTGSTATGRKVMESAAPTLKRVTLELGGNDAAIVLPGVDIDDTAKQLFKAAFGNSGQICVAAKRVYVHDDIYEPFSEAMVKLARAAKVGNGMEKETTFGPLQNKQQYERVKNLISDSRTNGHKFLIGEDSSVPDKGYFVPLTILDNPPADSRIVREEQFGPVLPLLRYRDLDEVIEQANSTEYGLGASVWGPTELAEKIAQRLEAGTVWINEYQTVAPSQPFGGVKQSGIGVENGLAGLLEYTAVQTIVTAKNAPASNAPA
jgi:aldehyde dehydrogenase (NAD+)